MLLHSWCEVLLYFCRNALMPSGIWKLSVVGVKTEAVFQLASFRWKSLQKKTFGGQSLPSWGASRVFFPFFSYLKRATNTLLSDENLYDLSLHCNKAPEWLLGSTKSRIREPGSACKCHPESAQPCLVCSALFLWSLCFHEIILKSWFVAFCLLC